MKNRTDIIGINFQDRLWHILRSNTRITGFIIIGIMGFFMSNSVIFGIMAPFGVALCAAADRENMLSAAVGSVLGYIFTFNLQSNMKYIIAITLIISIRWFFSSLPALAGSLRCRAWRLSA